MQNVTECTRSCLKYEILRIAEEETMECYEMIYKLS